MAPQPEETICDPACGTGGFLLAAHDFVARNKLDRDQKKHLKKEALHGWEIVPNTPDPDVIAGEIVEGLRTALEQFETIQTDLTRR